MNNHRLKEMLRAKHHLTQEEIVVFASDDFGSHRYCTATEWGALTASPPTVPTIGIHNTDIHNKSPADEKIALFQDLFCHRVDVYAKRWENAKKGTHGYAPACANQWSPLCPKTGGKKVKCSECDASAFMELTTATVRRHLEGKDVFGVYPLFPDETCKFLVIDFDDADYERDVLAFWHTCRQNDIAVSVERSRSGRGAHMWFFFSERIPATVARKLGSCLITKTMAENHSLKFNSYDRLFPSQDTMPQGGFGNLIALPLQRNARLNGNSEFVDMNFVSHPDQWAFLDNAKRYSLQEVEDFIHQLGDALGELHRDSDEDEKPWQHKKAEVKLQKSDFPTIVNIVKANMIYIEKYGLSSKALNKLKRLAAFNNPEFYRKQAMRLSTYDTPRIISISDESEKYLGLPRGLWLEVTQLFHESGVEIRCQNEVNEGREIDVTFSGELRPEQQAAIDALLSHDNGILSATTAFGKTVVAAALIGHRKVNTLILVHRASLLSQWIKRLGEFLVINEEPIAEYTKTGRIRKKNIIGQIGSSKNNPSVM